MKQHSSFLKKLSIVNYLLSIINYSVIFLVTLLFVSPAKAQVNVGSKNPPQSFSILELTTTNEKEGGLRLPQLKTSERLALNSQLTGDDAARGLVVFDTDLNCLEFWNGDKWISLCSDIIPPPVDPSTLNLGSGTLTGRTCFDIAESNDNSENGPLSGRTWKADFALIHT